MTELQTILIILGILLSPIYVMMIFLIKRLNFTCNTVSKMVTFLKLVHPKESHSLD